MDNLINKSDIAEFWPISVNLNDSRVDPYILRAEQNNLQSIMSPQLYNAFKNAFVKDFLNNEFENALAGWTQFGGAGTATWISNGLKGVTATLVPVTTLSSKVLVQQIFTKGLAFKIVANITTSASITFEVVGANKPDFTDAVVIVSAPAVSGELSIDVLAGAAYSFVGVRISGIAGGSTSILKLNLKMEDRWYKLFYGDVYKYGSSYDQLFPGVRQLLCAYSYAYVVDNNAIHITRGGVDKKVGEQSENATDKNIASKNQESYSEAIRLEGQFLQWISQKNGPFPEWDGSKPAKNASVNFFNASRCSKYGF